MNLIELQSDSARFRNALLIDTDAGPTRFSDVCEEWQDKDFGGLDSG